MKVTVTLPRLDAWGNLVALLGAVAVVVAIGGLTSNYWWSVLSGGLATIAFAVIAQRAEAEPAVKSAPAAAPAGPGPVLRAASE